MSRTIFAVLLLWSAALAICAFLAFAVPAGAQEQASTAPVCMPWAKFRDIAKKSFNEEPTGGLGIIDSHSIVTLLASPGGDTWTLVILGANDIACVVASGTNWMPENIPPAYTRGRSVS